MIKCAQHGNHRLCLQVAEVFFCILSTGNSTRHCWAVFMWKLADKSRAALTLWKLVMVTGTCSSCYPMFGPFQGGCFQFSRADARKYSACWKCILRMKLPINTTVNKVGGCRAVAFNSLTIVAIRHSLLFLPVSFHVGFTAEFSCTGPRC